MEGEAIWRVVMDCAHQLRITAFGGVVGLDFNAFITVGQARAVDLELLTEVLPAAETFIIFAWSKPS